MFFDTESYRQSNSDAHRTRSTNVVAPAMTWHMAFWSPQLVSDDDSEIVLFERSPNRKAIRQRLDQILIQIVKGLRQRPDRTRVEFAPCVNDTIVMFNDYASNHDLTTLRNFNASKRQKDIMDSDYRVLKIEFRWFDYWITIRCELQTEYFTITVIAEIIEECRKQLGTIDSVKIFARHLPDRETLPAQIPLAQLYELFWTQFNRFIRDLEGVRPLMADALFEQVYADFRGLVTTDKPPSVSSYPCAISAWGYDAVEKYKSDLTFANTYECTASFMLKRRVVYMTALGPQMPHHPPESRIPVTFVLCLANDLVPETPPVDRWQLGRLIDRINFLGRVRLAALRNIKVLRSVSTELGRLDPLMTTARQAVEAYSNEEGTDADCVRPIERAHQRLNAIAAGFLNHRDNVARSGILYRIERSRYYVNQFRKSVPLLRLSRLEGYQRYDQFVEKRLGGSFDSIDRIGIRFERAMQSMATIDQNYLAARSHRTGASVEEIQRYGELLLIAVLVPYYLISVIDHLVHASQGFFYVAAGIMFITTLLAVWRFSFSKSKTLGINLTFVRALFMGLAIFSVVTLIAHELRRAPREPPKTGVSHGAAPHNEKHQ